MLIKRVMNIIYITNILCIESYIFISIRLNVTLPELTLHMGSAMHIVPSAAQLAGV